MLNARSPTPIWRKKFNFQLQPTVAIYRLPQQRPPPLVSHRVQRSAILQPGFSTHKRAPNTSTESHTQMKTSSQCGLTAITWDHLMAKASRRSNSETLSLTTVDSVPNSSMVKQPRETLSCSRTWSWWNRQLIRHLISLFILSLLWSLLLYQLFDKLILS